ncbi:hypothetical protein GCM10017673_51590 [Streptosporangium violaceochromogenes]|nr:hypothetical protein GCM10017673_51590 [Streptosporangium violaceochromogenes]
MRSALTAPAISHGWPGVVYGDAAFAVFQGGETVLTTGRLRDVSVRCDHTLGTPIPIQ